jgi:tetratricopeptide (TPR) repeat protein
MTIEMVSNLTIGTVNYVVQTSSAGLEKTSIVTKIYRKGDLIHSEMENFGGPALKLDAGKLAERIRALHAKFFNTVRDGKFAKGKKARDFIDEAKVFLRKKSNHRALEVLRTAHSLYPDDPFVMSYYGCLLAIVGLKHSAGTALTYKALQQLKVFLPHGHEAHYPVFYLNAARAELASGDKKAAFETLKEGLRYDPPNGPLLEELKKLGIRRRPAIPFLDRSNPINKYIGLLVHRRRQDG